MVIVAICFALTGCVASPEDSKKTSDTNAITVSVDTNTTTGSVDTNDITTSSRTDTTTSYSFLNTTPSLTSYYEPNSIKALSAIVYNVDEGNVLFEKEINNRRYPASTTKLLTAIIALKYASPDEEYEVTKEVLSLIPYDASKSKLESGMKLSLRMLLEAMLMESGCDAAYVIADSIGKQLIGDPDATIFDAVSEFVQSMNKFANSIGAKNSHFINPDGYHHPDHYSTAYDIMLIAKDAYSIPLIKEIVKQEQVTRVLPTGQSLVWKNTNLLINKNSTYYCKTVIGMKTGFTNEAGNCLVASILKNTINYLIVIMNSPNDEQRWDDALLLINQFQLN
jgi:D-alanyl-D-alanine carboxypeptidase (penicillin-binding protein 5/6)